MSESDKRRFHDKAGGPATLISEGCKVAGVISGDGPPASVTYCDRMLIVRMG